MAIYGPGGDGGGGGLAFSRYVALLSQAEAGAPVATVLENGLGGAVVWARSSPGAYTATLNGAFTPDKTAVFFGGTKVEADFSANAFVVLASFHLSLDVIQVYSFYFNTDSPPGVRTDGLLADTEIEIRVYP